jgi:hypothetical protein
LDDKVIIPLGIALIVLVILILYREKLKLFFFEATRQGIRARLETKTQARDDQGPSIIISGNRQTGEDHLIDVGRDKTEVTKNIQSGKRDQIVTRPDPGPSSKK